MEIKNIKSVRPNRQLFKKVLALLFSVTVIVGAYMFMSYASEEASDTVAVMRLKSDEGLAAGVMLTGDHLETYNIIRREFDETMVEEGEEDAIIGQYTSYFLRGKSLLYEDQFVEEKIKKNEWLYELEEEAEVLTLPYNFLECGGDILMPGDRVRIRVAYEVEVPVDKSGAVDTGNPNMPGGMVASRGYGDTTTETRVDVLFESIVIKDMLNSNSHSIYEVYKEAMKLSEDKKAAVMKSEEFLKNIQPKALLLAGNSEQIEAYARYNYLDGDAFTITILNRQEHNIILDKLPTLEIEVESWIENENGE